MVEVVNRQRHVKITTELWRDFAEQVLKKLGRSHDNATIAFVSDRRIRELNREFRGRDSATDVLSFSAIASEYDDVFESNLGDVVISLEHAKAQAKENGLKFEREVAQLVLHGILHLCGYDHETDNGEMNRLELRLRRQLDI